MHGKPSITSNASPRKYVKGNTFKNNGIFVMSEGYITANIPYTAGQGSICQGKESPTHFSALLVCGPSCLAMSAFTKLANNQPVVPSKHSADTYLVEVSIDIDVTVPCTEG
jgi:hypothetical protein